MGLSPQLAAVLLCLLVCTGNYARRQDREAGLREIIHNLDQVLKKETPCTEMFVPDVLIATKNTTEKGLLCRATRVLRKFYFPREVTPCLKNNSGVLSILRKLCRSISTLHPQESCSVSTPTLTTLNDFLGRLRGIMQMKNWQG
ncbi:interleukin-4 [Meriones unguiculatus]|uniref:Interleukin-4 n=1 Tax=Meriones unguiculatus TaxID=10047 RepID=IL4_MERUN|nr:interleukin-4 [Meriones unguiculatus]P47966.1 RecName: Full=Interleukin-4; Short=IL-4; AltName: Full=B-cell stimulatory factor 1; Short=BSF-1; AltName: Full=Lymphocyte stimulatory factor 1; Flags: Precursor [Meriones unguiculatus]AAA65678.1 interleukin 4 [Meriones unguiculatus]